MKKYLSIGTCVLIIMTIISIIILLSKEPKEFKITTLKRDYHQVYLEEEETSLEIVIFSNHKSDKYLNKEMINRASLLENNHQNSYRVFVKEIAYLNDSITLKGEKFYCFKMIINIESMLEEINIPEAILSLEYYNNIVFNLSIGWVSLYKVSHFGSLNNELAICQLKGYTTVDEGIKKLQAIVIGLRNNSDKIINVNEITPLAGDVFFNNIIEIDDPNERFEGNFDIYNIEEEKEIAIELLPNETKYYILPIKYKLRKNLSNLGLEILYLKEGKVNQMFFDDFVFFSNNQISKFELNQMIINSYANYKNK